METSKVILMLVDLLKNFNKIHSSIQNDAKSLANLVGRHMGYGELTEKEYEDNEISDNENDY